MLSIPAYARMLFFKAPVPRWPNPARILFFKARFKNQPGYILRGPQGKRRWRAMNTTGQMPDLFNEPPVTITRIKGSLPRSAKEVYLRIKPHLVGQLVQKSRSG